MIDFTTAMPLPEAVESISRRTPLGTELSSAEWDLVPAEIRLRSLWAARLEDERLAASMQSKIAQFIKLERTKLAEGGEGVFMDRGLFIEKMREEFKKAGYRPDPKKKGTLQDFTSAGRLGLIWQMNLDQAQGYAQWKTAMHPDLLEAAPAWEFVRLEQRMERRTWPAKWVALGGTFYPGPSEYPEGRMIALKTDPIWKALNRFGVPWKPFDWGSGMGTKNVRWREAMKLGVIKDGDPPQTPDLLPFNAGAEASLKGISPARRRAIEDDFAGDVEIDGDVIRLLPPQGGDAMGGQPQKRGSVKFDGVDQPAPRPPGTPLADVVTAQDSKRHAGVISEIRRGLGLIDDVLGDGLFPDLTVDLRTPLFRSNQAGGYRPVNARGKIPDLFVNPNAVDPALTVIHENGHLLDNLGLHTPSAARNYASKGQPQLAELMKTIRQSVAVAKLADEAGDNSSLLLPQELFARAYAQFIAQQSADERLAETIKAIRLGELRDTGLFKDSQWTRADFNGINQALERLLKSLGWIPAQ